MRSTYLICYDICDDKRLRKDLSDRARFRRSPAVLDLRVPAHANGFGAMQRGARIIHRDNDQVLFVNLGPAEGRGERVITSMGKAYTALDAPCIIV